MGGVDFARQLAEKNREAEGRAPKRFKSSAAPKGTSMPTGYQDRAQLRNTQAEDEKGESIEARIKALEDMVKLGQIDQATFDKLRQDLGVGGDLESTHMVKGLDMELVRRIRAGEDVSKPAEKAPPPPPQEDVDDQLDHLMEEKAPGDLPSAPTIKKEKKKGNMAPPPARPRNRDEILRDLKAKHAAAAAPAPPPESTLGNRFKKIRDETPKKQRFEETDETGRRREVLLIPDAEGNIKRKTRWLDPPVQAPASAVNGLLMPDKSAKPLGMEVPAGVASAAPSVVPEDEDEDIFADAGADYNPLAGIENDGSSSEEDDEVVDSGRKREKAPASEDKLSETAPTQRRNYFGDEPTTEEIDRSNPLTKDPTILATLKRAAALRQASPSEGDEDQSSEAALRQKRFIEEARRRDAMDAADMDMGFGRSRNEDGDEEDDGPLLDFDDDDEKRGGQKRKRGPKKKKGNKDSATDVMRVVEGRKKDA